MTRLGISYADVSKAAQIIVSNGHNPIVYRVLAHFGVGSNGNFLAKYGKSSPQITLSVLKIEKHKLSYYEEIVF